MCFITVTKKKKADTVTALPACRGHSSHISIAFTTNFNFLWKTTLSEAKVKGTSQFNNDLSCAIYWLEDEAASQNKIKKKCY